MVKPELDSTKDYYSALGLKHPCTQVEIRRAFLDLARTQHPDKNPGREVEFKAKFQIITTAYDVLKDPTSKRTYDQVRPTQKKTPQYSSPKPSFATHPTKSASAKFAHEAAARASAFPRQAKTAPKSPPKSTPRKAPTAAKTSPFGDWKPPVPGNKPKTDPKSNRPTHTRFEQTAKPASAERKQPSFAGYSAFYHASPTAKKASGTSKPPASNLNPDTNASTPKGWWSKSSTAYTTFHAASSKFSKYSTATDPPLFDCSSPKAENDSETSAFEYFKRTSQTKASAPQDIPKAYASQFSPVNDSDEVYNWQKSRGAYQRKSPRINKSSNLHTSESSPQPSFRHRTGQNNCFTQSASASRDKDVPLDSDLIDDSSDDTSSAVPKAHGFTRNARPSQSTEVPRNKLSDSSSDSDIVTETDKSQPQSTAAFRTFRRARPHQTGRKLDSSTTRDKMEYTPAPHMARSPVANDEAKKIFSFTFNPPTTTKAQESRRVSANVPYVHFNAVPDFNFSSPNTPQSATNNVHVTTETLSDRAQAKKHSRLDDSADPRFPKQHDTTESMFADLSTGLSNLSFQKSSSPEQNLSSQKSSSPSKTTLQDEFQKADQTEASSKWSAPQSTPKFEFRALSAGKAFTFTTPPTMNSSTTIPKPETECSPQPPHMGESLLRKLDFSGTFQDFQPTYISYEGDFVDYLKTWQLYVSAKLTGKFNPEYLAALKRHEEVCKNHHSNQEMYLDKMTSLFTLHGPP